MFSGIKLPRTMARPEMLPTDTWLGIRKKNTAAATMTVAKVIIKNSRIASHFFIWNLQ